MKKPINPIIIASLIILVGIVFYSLSNRYYIDTSTRLIVDRLTGKVSYAVVEPDPAPVSNTQYDSINEYKTKSGGVFAQIRRDEYLNNLNLLIGSEDMMIIFRDYYNGCISNIKKDPLFYSEKLSAFNFGELEKYGPLLSPPNIAIVYNDEGISDPDKYTEYLHSILDQ